MKIDERSFSLIMLVAIAFFAGAILLLPTKPAPRSDARGESVEHEQGEPDVDVPTYSLPLSKVIRLPISSVFVFKVTLVSGESLVGSLTESGGTCFGFHIMDEEAYVSYLENGPSSLMNPQGKVYVSINPVHYRLEFNVHADQTGDYYVVLISPPGACHGKTVTIGLHR